MRDRKTLTTEEAIAMAASGSLKKWDVEFVMGVEVFYNILDFLTELHGDIPMSFYPDRVTFNIVSYDNTQYAETIIPKGDLLRYDSGLAGSDSSGGDGIDNNIGKAVGGNDKDYKFVVVDIMDIIDDIAGNVSTGQLIRVRIDTGYMKRIEFHFGTDDADTKFERDGDTIIWARLIDEGDVRGKTLRLSEKIKKAREDPNITKAEIAFEPATFNKIVSMTGKGKKSDVDQKFLIQADNNGVIVSSGDKMFGRIFKIKKIAGDSYHSEGIGGTVEGYENYHEEYDGEYEDEDKKEGEREDKKEGEREDKKEGEREDKKAFRKGTDKHQLLALNTDSMHYVRFNREYMKSFTKLKGLSPITVEIRTNRPIIIRQDINDIECMMSVAPVLDDD